MSQTIELEHDRKDIRELTASELGAVAGGAPSQQGEFDAGLIGRVSWWTDGSGTHAVVIGVVYGSATQIHTA